MKNRLEVAKKLLTSDDCSIVAIDENEQAKLAVLLEEIFRDHEIQIPKEFKEEIFLISMNKSIYFSLFVFFWS